MAEEKKTQEEQEKSAFGERMSDISGIRIFRDGKWFSLDELTKKKEEPEPEAKKEAPAEKKPVVASSYLDSVLPKPVIATAGSEPAPKEDQIEGSDKNEKGSAASGRKITFSKAVEKSLEEKVKSHNESVSADSKKVTLSMLKAVYRRGAGAFSSSHRPDQNRNSWAMGRVNAYLRLVKSGKPDNAKYTTDNDLLPKSHPKSTRASVVASALEDDYESELSVVLFPETEYTSKEHAMLALAEFSGMGYEILPALQASWNRAEQAEENPFDRAKELAVLLYESKDSDLLPKEF